MKKGLLCLMLLLFATVFVGAQTVNNTALVGTVTDATNAVIVGAHVTATNRDTKVSFEVVTNAEGYYSITGGVNPGTYDVTVVMQGFSKTTSTGAIVVINEVTRTDVVLKAGSTNQEVSVSANTPAIQTDDSLLGETVSEKMVEDLPLSSRNPLNLAATQSNVTVSSTDPLSGTPPGVQVSGGGARGVNNGITLDGITIMNDLIVTTTIAPNPDTIGAVQMQTGNYTAQYGDYLGTHVNESTKSGTNSFHGTAFDYIQNDAFNSRGFNRNALPLPTRTHLRQNTFGGVISGPIWIPHLINGRDKLFFMGSYQGFRKNSIPNAQFQTWTPAERGGDFSVFLNPTFNGQGAGKGTLLYSPFDGHQYFNASTGKQQIDDQPAAVAGIVSRVLAYAPVANHLNAGDTTGNATNISSNALYPVVSTTTYNQSNDRLDWTPTEKDRFFGRYIFQKALVIGGSNQFVNNSYSPSNSRNASVGYTRIITPNIVNDFRVGFNWLTTNTVNYFYQNGITGADTALQIPGFNIGDSSGNPGLPDLTGNSIFSISESGTNWFQDERTYQIYDQISWTKGKHTIMAGADFRRNALARASANNARGQEGFNASYTGTAGNSASPTGCADMHLTTCSLGLADAAMYVGVAQADNTPITQAKIEVQQWRDGFFVQDQWLATKKLTLQYGVRYELPGVPTSLNGTGRLLDPTLSFLVPPVPTTCTTASCAIGLNPGFAFHAPNHKDIAPRFGFAYRVSDRVTLRGGGGMYYSEVQMNAYTLMNQNFPLANTQSYSSPTAKHTSGTDDLFTTANQAALVRLNNPAPGAAAATIVPGPGGTGCNTSNGTGSCATSVVGDQYNIPSETEYQWNLDNGIALWKNAGLELQYTGQHSINLNYSNYSNQPNPGVGTQTLSVNARRPDLNWGQKRIITDGGTSTYEGLTVNFRQRTVHGLTANFSYTWAQNLDEVNYANGGGSPMWQGHLKIDYGPATGGDIKHNAVLSFGYQLPSLAHHNFLVQEALGGWQVNGIITMTSAGFYNVNITNDWANVGIPSNAQRLNFVHVGNAHQAQGCTKASLLAQPYGTNAPSCLDSSAYAAPAQYTYGNAHRNDLRGPNGKFANDMSLFKTFKIFENLNFQLRAEAFNAINHANMGNPGDSGSQVQGTAALPTLTNPSGFVPGGSFGQAGIGSAGRTFQLAGKINF